MAYSKEYIRNRSNIHTIYIFFIDIYIYMIYIYDKSLIFFFNRLDRSRFRTYEIKYIIMYYIY